MCGHRICNKCGAAKPVEDYYLNNNGNPLGECKACTRHRTKTNKALRSARLRTERKAEAARLLAMSHKHCTWCKEDKPFAEFYVSERHRGGLFPHCKVCQRTKVKAHAAKLRAIHGPRKMQPSQVAKRDALYAIAHAVKAEPCADCATAYPPPIMHFHHVDPAAKTIGIAALIRKFVTPDVLLAEISKCVVLCPNCHALRHLREREGG